MHGEDHLVRRRGRPEHRKERERERDGAHVAPKGERRSVRRLREGVRVSCVLGIYIYYEPIIGPRWAR